MAGAEKSLVKSEKQSAVLRSKIEEKQKERAARRSADASGYNTLSAK